MDVEQLERQAAGLAQLVLDQERAMQTAEILLREPDRKVKGTHNARRSDLARWVLRRELRRTEKEGGDG
jgi:hypothetical protein